MEGSWRGMTEGSWRGMTDRRGGRTKSGIGGEREGEMNRRSGGGVGGEFLYVSIRFSNVMGGGA